MSPRGAVEPCVWMRACVRACVCTEARGARAAFIRGQWQLCAAMRRLPGQGGRGIIFAHAPKTLEVSGIGRCSNGMYAPHGCEAWQEGYASADIFYMEACLFSQICSNRDELWSLDENREWYCQLDYDGWQTLKRWLVFEGL